MNMLNEADLQQIKDMRALARDPDTGVGYWQD